MGQCCTGQKRSNLPQETTLPVFTPQSSLQSNVTAKTQQQDKVGNIFTLNTQDSSFPPSRNQTKGCPQIIAAHVIHTEKPQETNCKYDVSDGKAQQQIITKTQNKTKIDPISMQLHKKESISQQQPQANSPELRKTRQTQHRADISWISNHENKDSRQQQQPGRSGNNDMTVIGKIEGSNGQNKQEEQPSQEQSEVQSLMEQSIIKKVTHPQEPQLKQQSQGQPKQQAQNLQHPGIEQPGQQQSRLLSSILGLRQIYNSQFCCF